MTKLKSSGKANKIMPSKNIKKTGLKHSAEIYRNLIEATADSIYMVDLSCRYIYANPRYCSRLNLPLQEIIGQQYSDFHNPEETAKFEKDVLEVLQNGEPFQREYKSKRDSSEFLRTFYPIRQSSSNNISAVGVIAKDITDLRHAQELYTTLSENSPIGFFIIQDGIIKWANNKLSESMDYSLDQLIDKPYSFFIHPEDRQLVKDNSIAMLQGTISLPYEYRIITKKGEHLWHVGTVSSISYLGQRAVLGSQMDITAQKNAETKLRQSEERYRTIIDTITDAYYEVDLAGNTTVFNEAYLKLYEYSAQEMQGKNYKTYVDKEKAQMAYWVFNQVFKTGKPTKKMEWEIIAKSGKKKNVELSVSLILDANGKAQGFRGIISDITDRLKAEEIIRHQAFHDPLTGLANRILFYDRMQMAFKLAKRNQKMVAVIILDIDRFKEINDTHGHMTGDEILKSVAERLSRLVRSSDTVARYGGDEFTLIMPSLSCEEDALVVVKKIVSVFDSPFQIAKDFINVTSSVGVAIYPAHGTNTDALISKADNAMYRAKAMGRNKYCFYGNESDPSN
jgi:diguanylate cyclase (GGDEF)-like protein/PAS domain S-box-containing protein